MRKALRINAGVKDIIPKKKKSAVARSLRDGEKNLRQLKAKDTLGRYRSVAHRGSLYLSIKTIAPVDRCWMTFSLDRLRAFIAAADEGSFSAGGRRLRRARSVVSQTLANMEVQLGRYRSRERQARKAGG